MATTQTVAPGAHPPAGGTVADDHSGGHTVFPPFDSSTFASQLLWLAIAFVLLYYLMARVAIPRIAGILEVRRDRIASDLDMAERLKSESQDAIAGYEKALAGARARAFAIAEGARNESKAAADAQRTGIEAELNRKLAAAETRIGDIKAQALKDVGAIAGEATEAIVRSLVGAEVAAKDVSEAVAGAMQARGGANAG